MVNTLRWLVQVSPDAVAISYSAFWEGKEYWRAVTASFSHFEILHMAFNMMGLWNLRILETFLGSFRHFYLVSVSLRYSWTALHLDRVLSRVGAL